MVLVFNENESSATVYPSKKCNTLGNEGRKIVHYVYGELQRCTKTLILINSNKVSLNRIIISFAGDSHVHVVFDYLRFNGMTLQIHLISTVKNVHVVLILSSMK